MNTFYTLHHRLATAFMAVSSLAAPVTALAEATLPLQPESFSAESDFRARVRPCSHPVGSAITGGQTVAVGCLQLDTEDGPPFTKNPQGITMVGADTFAASLGTEIYAFGVKVKPLSAPAIISFELKLKGEPVASPTITIEPTKNFAGVWHSQAFDQVTVRQSGPHSDLSYKAFFTGCSPN